MVLFKAVHLPFHPPSSLPPSLPSLQLVRCNAMLHPHDVPAGTTLVRDAPPGQARQQQPTPLETDPAVIRRGIHVSVYVKDVFPNSGRFSVTLDPTVDKQKVVIARRQKRELSKKRNKVKKLEGVEEGLEKKAQVVKVGGGEKGREGGVGDAVVARGLEC